MAIPHLVNGKEVKERNVLFNGTLNTFYLWKEMFYFMLLFLISSKGSFICTIPQIGYYIQMPLLHQLWITDWKEGNVLFNDALNTFYLRLYGVRHMVKDHSESEKGNLLLPYRLLFMINSKGSFICTIPQTG